LITGGSSQNRTENLTPKKVVKRGPGRPPRAPEKRKVQVQLRLEPADVRRLIELAEAVGVPQSTLARVVVKDYLDHPHPVGPKESLAETPARQRLGVDDEDV
jgi:hypothetical protein